MDEKVRRLAELCKKDGVLVFTGAGISAESGIPTFRGEGGLWTKFDVEKVATIEAFERDPSMYWNFFREVRLPLLDDVRPNAAHLAITELERRGYLTAVVTQNIDGLHQEAGTKKVLELHGSTRRFRCTNCPKFFDFDTIKRLLKENFPPLCPNCSSVVRPDVVLFGEPLPQNVLIEALRIAKNSSLAISVGSSLVVYPAATVPQYAEKLAIINLEPTPLDIAATVVIYAKAGDVLPKMLDHLE